MVFDAVNITLVASQSCRAWRFVWPSQVPKLQETIPMLNHNLLINHKWLLQFNAIKTCTLTVESPEALAMKSPLLLEVTSQIREVWPPPLPSSPSPKTRTRRPSSTSHTCSVLSLHVQLQKSHDHVTTCHNYIYTVVRIHWPICCYYLFSLELWTKFTSSLRQCACLPLQQTPHTCPPTTRCKRIR
jgi:hypothetical protein